MRTQLSRQKRRSATQDGFHRHAVVQLLSMKTRTSKTEGKKSTTLTTSVMRCALFDEQLYFTEQDDF